MRSIILSIIFILCSQTAFANEKPFNVAVLYWSMKIEGQVAMAKGLEEWAQKINTSKKYTRKVKLIKRVAGEGDVGIKNQVKQMYEVLKLKPDAIILQPTDTKELSKPVVEANKLGIPVVVYDQHVDEGKMTSYITSNNYQGGFLGGEYISNTFKNSKPLKIVIVEYPSVSSTIERVDGFIAALKKHKQKYTIINRYNAVDPVSGKKAAKQILKDFPEKNSIDVIFTVNDGGGLSIVEELKKKNRFEIKVVTNDGDPKSILNIVNKKITVIDSAQFCAELGRMSMKITYNHLIGKKVPKKVLVPTFPITYETIKYYKGWMSHLPKKFKKSWNNEYWNNNLVVF